MSNICLEFVQWAQSGSWAGHGPHLQESKLCLEFDHVQCLSRVCPMGRRRAMGCGPHLTESRLCLEFVQDFVQEDNKSQLCPEIVHVQCLSRVSPIARIYCWQGLIYDWTSCGQILDFHVQSLSESLCVDTLLTGLGQGFDKLRTYQPIGQRLDKGLTEIGQTSDFTSNLCPTNQWEGVPKSVVHFRLREA